MKAFKKLLMLFVALFMVAGCDTPEGNDSSSSNVSGNINTESPSSVEDSSDTSSEEDSSSSDEIIVDDEYNVLPNWEDEHYDISYGQDFLDVTVNRAFMTGAEYSLSYTLGSSLPSTGETVISSNEKVFTVELVGTTIKLKALHAGKAKLRIIDSNDVIRWCGTITVEDPIPLDYMEEYLVYDCEYWVSVMSWGDSYTITFNEGGVFTISGSITNVAFAPITGKYYYSETINNGKEHVYLFEESQELNETGFTGFHIAATGTFMYLQYYGGTDAILFPNHLIDSMK